MEILERSYQTTFDALSKKTRISVGFQGQDAPNFITATIVITSADLASEQSLDSLTEDEVVSIARKKLSALTAIDTASDNTASK